MKISGDTITLETPEEKEVLWHALNWNVSALGKSQAIDTKTKTPTDEQNALLYTAVKMWEDYNAKYKPKYHTKGIRNERG